MWKRQMKANRSGRGIQVKSDEKQNTCKNI